MSKNEITRRDPLDEQLYLKSYPYVNMELREKKGTTPRDPYEERGSGRGFLPNLRAACPDNAATQLSAFGGLWPDEANALDILEGKLRIVSPYSTPLSRVVSHFVSHLWPSCR